MTSQDDKQAEKIAADFIAKGYDKRAALDHMIKEDWDCLILVKVLLNM